MKDVIIQGIEQAYQNLVHMLAEFLPRLVVMLVIVAVGFLIALTLKYILRGLLHLTKLDRLSEEAGASHVLRMAALPSITELLSQCVGCRGFAGTDFAVVSAPAGDFCGHFDFIFGTGDRKFSLARRALGGGECGISIADAAELVSTCSSVDPCGFDGTRGDRHRQANGCGGVFDCVWRVDAGDGDCFWSGRTAPGSQVSGEASRTEGESKT